jgi:peptidoglycan/xylan/chitin deacetylase (PgdA/CDA1 family)
MDRMKDLVYFGNHTWSHHSVIGTKEILNQEISWADRQLSEKGFNDQKIFAYPYGEASSETINILKENEYALAFTTKYGNIMCKDKSLELPRIRVSNKPLNNFGL